MKSDKTVRKCIIPMCDDLMIYCYSTKNDKKWKAGVDNLLDQLLKLQGLQQTISPTGAVKILIKKHIHMQQQLV